MTQTPTVSEQWKAPPEDGGILIWPGVEAILGQTRENGERLESAECRIQNVPLHQLRSEARKWLGHEEGQPLIASGHQVELYHPGVWAKDVLCNRLARELGGEAYHFAVDTDAPKHLNLRWPGESWPITDDARVNSAAWSGILTAPSPRHIDMLRGRLEAAAREWDFAPAAGEFLLSMRRLSLESTSLASNLVNSTHEMDWKLGLRHHALAASPMWQSPAYLAFVHHILARCGEFASIYNRTLGEYRRANGIGNSGRPWPDLKIEGDACEAPFWMDDLSGESRSRAYVRRRDHRLFIEHADGVFGLELSANAGDAAGQLGRFLAQRQLRLSPRAATLTMFLRLLVVEQFIHGIGGGRYDRITDGVIRRLFGIEPPAYSVTTATLRFPAAVDGEIVDVDAEREAGRRMRHGWNDPTKREMAARIDQLPRKSMDRQGVYRQMHRYLDVKLRDDEYERWRQRFEQVQALHSQQRQLMDRELFFALQSEERLKGLIARYDAC